MKVVLAHEAYQTKTASTMWNHPLENPTDNGRTTEYSGFLRRTLMSEPDGERHGQIFCTDDVNRKWTTFRSSDCVYCHSASPYVSSHAIIDIIGDTIVVSSYHLCRDTIKLSREYYESIADAFIRFMNTRRQMITIFPSSFPEYPAAVIPLARFIKLSAIKLENISNGNSADSAYYVKIETAMTAEEVTLFEDIVRDYVHPMVKSVPQSVLDAMRELGMSFETEYRMDV